eukprot:TRINITY_DN106802_c0_g1_i1.p1 TRINITY_DN106802_c0_g1~~TRINITY_DN106802_c0_g1_i1.p1  ORF type:complete len:218 (+),score=66.81 TRINITY_DN106802_c0_g1_i1:90-743(+)
MSPEEVKVLLSGGGRYSSDIVPDLEKHLEEQLAKGSFDADANLALLKLYLLHPALTNMTALENVLLKGLMAYPETHFSMCMFQIPEKYHADLKPVIKLSQQLEMAKFKAFWKEAETVEVLKKAKGWEESVRDFISGVISNMYRSIRSEQLMELLNISKKEDLDARIKKQSWTRSKEDKDLVVVNTASFESIRVDVKGPTNMSLDQYKSLFFAASTVM